MHSVSCEHQPTFQPPVTCYRSPSKRSPSGCYKCLGAIFNTLDLQHPRSCTIPVEIRCRCHWCKQQATAVSSQIWSSGGEASKGDILWWTRDVCQYCVGIAKRQNERNKSKTLCLVAGRFSFARILAIVGALIPSCQRKTILCHLYSLNYDIVYSPHNRLNLFYFQSDICTCTESVQLLSNAWSI